MAIITGDHYHERLVRFVENNVGHLLDGNLTLKLNPTGLYYVQSRLDALRELEGLLVGAPVDYFRAYISDLGDYRALEQLRRILRLLTSVKVFSVLPFPDRDPTPLSLGTFGSLKILELRGCDLSTTEARGLLNLSHSLEKLICHNSTDALRHVFTSRLMNVKDSPVWKRLTFVSCASNGLVLMDESLQLLTAVETLDLSRNKISKPDNLGNCMKLRHLDLGFNNLRTIASLGEISCPIVKLVLRNNALTTLRGIENLKEVEGIDLSYNIISNFFELEILSTLPSLKNLWLEGNPICCARWYRAHVYSFFHQPNELELDGKVISTGEFWEMQAILTRRLKRPPGYGFYFPAKHGPGNDRQISVKKKRHSRVVCINEEQCEVPDKDSVSSDGDYLRKDENIISDSEEEITELISRIEAMKKEHSILWLRDVKDWLDKTAEELQDGKNTTASNSNDDKVIFCSQSEDHKLLGESKTKFIEASEIENVINVPESDIDNGKTISKTNLTMAAFGSQHHEPEICSTSKSNLSETPLSNEEHETGSLNQTAQLFTLENIMGSRSNSSGDELPPQYKDDMLLHLYNVEDENLKHPSDSISVVSSNSDTSSSDDELCRFGYSSSENSLKEGYINDIQSDHSYGNEQQSSISNRDVCPKKVYCTQPLKSANKDVCPTNSIVNNHPNDDFDHIVGDDEANLDIGNFNQKPRKRLISLFTDNFLRSKDPPSKMHSQNILT